MKIEIIERTEHTRNPTAKRVYKTRFNYKIRIISDIYLKTDVIYDTKSKLSFYIIGVDLGCLIAVSLNPTIKSSIPDEMELIRICSACSE